MSQSRSGPDGIGQSRRPESVWRPGEAEDKNHQAHGSSAAARRVQKNIPGQYFLRQIHTGYGCRSEKRSSSVRSGSEADRGADESVRHSDGDSGFHPSLRKEQRKYCHLTGRGKTVPQAGAHFPSSNWHEGC